MDLEDFIASGLSDDELREAVDQAHIASLLTTLAALTGDDTLIRDEFRPTGGAVSLTLDPHGGLAEDRLAEARAAAFEALRRLRDAPRPPAQPSPERLERLMRFITGPVDSAYRPLMEHELGLAEDAGAPRWHADELHPGSPVRALVVGAGLSGIAAGHRLLQAGLVVTIVERNADVGGVWLENDYPGARLDTSNFTYSYSFAQHGGWRKRYSPRDEILGYLRDVADRFGIRERVRFRTRVTALRWDDEARLWHATTRDEHGVESELQAEFVISAVGQLNEPLIPDIPGAATFRGPAFHTARWDHSAPIDGARVGVIGTGASAFQVIPQVARTAGEVVVFQRTPAWVIPTPRYNADIEPGLHLLLERLPQYHRWYRFAQFWNNVEGIRSLALVDPAWEHPVSVSAANDEMRRSLTRFLEEEFADRPDLRAILVPEYAPYAKRAVRDDGTWTNALKQPHVRVVVDPIRAITPHGIETADGAHHDLDTIVYGTGFRASEFLSSITVTGRDGADLHARWGGDARAFWGTSVPGFPNLFLLYGPNTNLNVNGSVVLFVEAAIEFALAGIRTVLEHGMSALDVREEAYDAYNRRIDEASLGLAIGASSVNSWYKNRFGRNSQNWPLTTLEYWQGTRGPTLEDYDLLP